jgi:hypothetical protein
MAAQVGWLDTRHRVLPGGHFFTMPCPNCEPIPFIGMREGNLTQDRKIIANPASTQMRHPLQEQ